MSDPAKRQGHQLHIGVFNRGNQLFSRPGWNVIDVSGSSKTLRSVFLLQNKAFVNQLLEVLLQSVMAEAYLALDFGEALGFAVSKRG